MKKSFFVFVCVVSLISVFVVGLVGIKYKSYESTISSREVVCDRVYVEGGEWHELRLREDGVKYATVELAGGQGYVRFDADVLPEDATIRQGFGSSPCTFSGQSACATVDRSSGTVTFTKPGSITVTITPADGANCSLTVILRAKAQQ